MGFYRSVAVTVMTTAMAAAGAALLASGAQAQGAPARERLEPRLREVANALGLVRGPSTNEVYHEMNAVEYVAAGTMAEPAAGGAWTQYKVNRYTAGLTYYLPASRIDIERVGPSGQTERVIRVVDRANAWNEGEPGLQHTPAESGAAEWRRRLIWVTPQGFAWQFAVAKAPVTWGTEGGKRTMTINVEGAPMKAVLGADHRPERIETQVRHPVLGNTRLVATYSDYKDDGYDVFVPNRVVHTLGGRQVLDVTVSAVLTNPYMVYPQPPFIR
jgi:hypothetical protein